MNKNLKYYLIFNPAANHGRASKLIPQVEAFFTQWKLDYTLVVTREPKEAIALAKAAANKFAMVVAIGGDGTINEVANGLIGSETIMGIVPVGAGNDFSKALGLKHVLRDNLEILLRGEIREVDIGKVNNLYFINVLGVGFDALVAKEMSNRPGFLKGFPVYVYSLFKSLVHYHLTKFKITFNDFAQEGEYLTVAIANGEFFGGGFHIAPRASVEDGLFDICLAGQMSRNYLVKSLPKLIKGTHDQLPEIKMFKTKKVIIEAEKELPVEYDGELLRGQKKLTIEVIPRVLKIMGK